MFILRVAIWGLFLFIPHVIVLSDEEPKTPALDVESEVFLNTDGKPLPKCPPVCPE